MDRDCRLTTLRNAQLVSRQVSEASIAERAARMRSIANFFSYSGAVAFCELSSTDSPATPVPTQSFTFAATSSGSSANPFRKSAFYRQRRCVHNFVNMREHFIARDGAIGLPREKAKPAEVVVERFRIRVVPDKSPSRLSMDFGAQRPGIVTRESCCTEPILY